MLRKRIDSQKKIRSGLTAIMLAACHIALAQNSYVFPENITPLIHTQWGQGHPFNLLCPEAENTKDETIHKLAGCGAVAMAQMVNYHQYPSMSPDKTYKYDWGLMYCHLSIVVQREELVAVAKLISDCGVSSFTEYGNNSSSTSISRMMGALKRLFNYSNYMSIYERSAFANPQRDSLFRQLIFTELKSGRPVLYRGYNEKEGGHLFIIDGCKKQKVHVNMGWAGQRDGYYDLDDLSGYNQQQWLLTDVADSSYRAMTKEITLNEPGTLGTLLDKQEILTTRHIKLFGRMDGQDFSTLREMLREGLLRTIDMEQVNLEELPDSAFFECTYLSHFVAPLTLQRTGQQAFFRCRNLNRVVFRPGLRAVGNAAFSGCTNLIDVQLPNTVTYIGYNAFTSCEALLNVVLPEGIESLGNYAFSYCKHLYSISLPKSLRSIGKDIFKDCDRLTHIRLAPENPYFIIDGQNEIQPRKPDTGQ
jgi:hypothetical protein